MSRSIVVLVLVLAGIALHAHGSNAGSCSYRKWERSGDIKLLVVASLHEKTGTLPAQCSDTLSRTNFPLILALDWMVDLLNGNSSNPSRTSFIPGVTIGYDLYDNCDDEDLTTDLLYPAPGADCTAPATPVMSNTHIGTIVVSNVESTRVVQKLTYPRPVIRPLQSIPGLESEEPTNLFHTTLSFHKEAQAITDLLLKLQWNFIIVINNKDAYGIQTSNALLSLARQHNICVNFTGPPVSDSISNIHYAMASAINVTVTIVYLEDNVERLETFIDLVNKKERPSQGKITWLFPSSVGADTTVSNSIKGEDSFVTVADNAINIHDFQDYIDLISTGVPESPISNMTKSYLDQNRNISSSRHIKATIDAVLSLVSSANSLYKKNCGTKTDLEQCPDLYEDFQSGKKMIELINVVVDIDSIFPSHYLPNFYKNIAGRINFTDTGTSMFTSMTIAIYKRSTSDYTTLLRFTSTDTSFSSSVLDLQTSSVCRGYCEACQKENDVRYSYLDGDILLLGLFSLRQYGDSPYTCGDFRQGTNDILTVSSFMESILAERKLPGSPNYGAIAIDDCYNAINTSQFLIELFSKQKLLKNPDTGKVIDFDKVVLIVGALSSPVSLVIGDISTAVGIPMVSYSASSPELDNKERYPYFLRTVPSDDLQVKALVAILVELSVTHVGVIYIDDAYGQKGNTLVQKEALLYNICIEEPLQVTQEMTRLQLKTVISKLYLNQVQVVIYFSIDSIAKTMIEILESDFSDQQPLVFIASEAWGTNQNLITGNLGKQSKGSVVLKIETRLYKNPDYRQFLQELHFSNTSYNRWIPKFFEDLNDCDFIGSYDKSHSKLCASGGLPSLDSATIDGLYTDQRAVHVKQAVNAATKGYEEFCKTRVGTCSPLSVRLETKSIINTIKAVKLDNMALFDDDGNGDIGYSIYNIQKNSNNDVFYKPVGKYTNDGKLKLTEQLKFYNDLHSEIEITEVKNTQCTKFPKCFDICILPTTTTSTSEAPTAATLTTKNPVDSTMLITTIVFGVLVAIMAVALILVIVLLLRRQTGLLASIKSDSDTGQYHSSCVSNNSDGVYNLPDDVKRHHQRFDNSAFINDSGLSTPRSAKHGTIGSLSSLNTKPIQYAHLRQRSNPEIHFNHVRQRSNHELQSENMAHVYRPESTLSAPMMTRSDISPVVRRMLKPTFNTLPPKMSASSSYLTPHSAPEPLQHQNHQYRQRASSSPRFRYPYSDDEERYTNPDIADDIFYNGDRNRKYGESYEHGHADLSNIDHVPESHQPEGYLVTSEEQADSVVNDSTITYLTAKDFVNSSDEEEDAIRKESGSFTYNPNLAENDKHSNAKYSVSSSHLSPSDVEVMDINFPPSESGTVSKQTNITKDGIVPLEKQLNDTVNTNINTNYTNLSVEQSRQPRNLSNPSGQRASISDIPDVIRHGPYEEDGVFII